LIKVKIFLEPELSKVETSRKRLIDSVTDGLFSREEVAEKIEEIRERENLFRSEIGLIAEQLTEGPTEEEVHHKAKLLKRMIGEAYRSPSQLEKMTFDEQKKLVSTFFAGKDTQNHRLGVYLERDKKNEAVKYEIQGIFGQTFNGTVTPEELDILDFKDASSEHLEDLKVAIRVGGGEVKSKPSKSLSTKDRPYHAKQNIHGKDWRNDPQVEQWVA
jgi:hypothetical protein